MRPANVAVNLMFVCLAGVLQPCVDVVADEKTANGPWEMERVDPQLKKEIAVWVEGLDDDNFSQRHACHQKLVKAGWPALGEVQAALGHPSAEVRRRARLILEKVQYGWLNEEFARLAQLEEGELDVEYGMWLISLIVNPLASRRRMTQQLDDLAAAVQRRIGPKTDARTLAPRQLMEALRDELFVEQGFTGAVNDYDRPENSSLEYVLTKRRGLPISLSHLVVCVARRLKVPVYGFGVSRTYLVMYDHRQAPQEQPDELYLHAFEGGKLLNRKELTDTLARMGTNLPANSTVSPDKAAEIIRRMLANLSSDYQVQGDPKKAEWVSGLSQQFGTPVP